MYQRLGEIIQRLEMQPGKALQAAQLVGDWLATGCDAELDILPAINKVRVNSNGPITSPAYFDKAVRRAHAERTGDIEVKRQKIEMRAKAFAWKRKRERFLNSHELAELTQYEQQYGPLG